MNGIELQWSALQELITYQETAPLLFNSGAFFLLFTLFYGGYVLLLHRINWRTLYVLAFSIFFYYKCSGFFFLLLILSTVSDFVLGHFIYHSKTPRLRRIFLWLSILVNLGMLGYFKYTNFFIDSWNAISGGGISTIDLFLPVGISFFTFQTMSYSIDVYRGKLLPVTEHVHDLPSFFRALMDFGFFVSFFPQLVAGPIVRAADFIPQIRQRLVLKEADISKGLLLIAGGLFKKAVISDYISVNFVDRVFESPALYSGFENLMASYGYAIQIYCDFSGYSDMAIGLALLMGFQLPENFRKPYRALSIRDFWRRWHISLSTWLRDYLYISMGGNRHSRRRTYLHLMVTMLLGGLWHGPSWVFIAWGGLHGLALAMDRGSEESGKRLGNPALRSLLVLITVHLITQLVLWTQFQGGIYLAETYQHYTRGNFMLLSIWVCLYGFGGLWDAIAERRGRPGCAHRLMSGIFVFHFVTFCWIFFRAGALNNPLPPMETAGAVLGQLFGAFELSIIPQVAASYGAVFSLILLGFVLHFLPENWQWRVEQTFLRLPLPAKSFVMAGVIWIVIQTASSDIVPFIYFQF